MKINRVIFDVDGVFTDGSFIYDSEGKRFKIFGAHDSDGLKLLANKNISLQAITADHRGFSINKRRMDDMGLGLLLVSENERLEFFKRQSHIDKICFMGDGHFDSMVFDIVGYSIAPANALEITKNKASYVTKAQGGKGAVYEASIHILNLIKKYD
tara:strand:- start:4220 stop:4687 length:468 start_codon:yes stop_codon:yes gene_type:complete